MTKLRTALHMLAVLVLSFSAYSTLGLSTTASAQAGPTFRPPAELPVAVLLTPFRATDGHMSVHVWLEIPGHALNGTVIKLNVVVEALDADGKSHADFNHDIALTDDQANSARSSSLKLHGRLDLAPAPYQLHLKIRGAEDQTLVDRKLDFEAQPFQAAQAAVLPPLFIDDEGESVVFRRPEQDANQDPFLTAGNETFVPNVVPVLEEGPSRARITMIGYHLKKDQSLLDARLLNAEGSLLGKDRLGVVAQSETAADGLDRFDFSLQTEGLPPGDYQLEVSIQDFEFGRTDQTLMPFVIE